MKMIIPKSICDVTGIAEFDCNHGIADLVLYKLRPRWELADGLQYLSPRWAAALYALPYRRGFTDEWFAECNLVTRRRALRALNEYANAGYCEQMKIKGRWIKVRQPQRIVSEINAIEAKLRDWQRALIQAARYRAFAHRSWVLLDEATIKPAIARLDRFKDLNVGLVSLSTDGIIHHYYMPEKRTPPDAWRFWFANVLIARAVSQDISGSTC